MKTKPTTQKVTLNRSSADELNKGIKELENRGYELLKRGESEREIKDFHYRENKGQKLRFTGATTYGKHTAVMTREYLG